LTAARLIERAQRGEGAAQEELWCAHRRWVAAIVLAHRPRALEVDDLMQDVALKMIDKLDTLRDAAAFKPWLRRIIINTCRGAARSIRPELRFSQTDREDLPDHPASHAAVPHSHEPDSAQWIETRDAAERLLAQAMTLPAEYREPLLLRCVQSLTYQQISDVLELPVTTIETRLARARRMLREEVGEQVAGECATEVERSRARRSGAANDIETASAPESIAHLKSQDSDHKPGRSKPIAPSDQAAPTEESPSPRRLRA
jgi:RNA polymerase sigma-70 factor, ECF subfamily